MSDIQLFRLADSDAAAFPGHSATVGTHVQNLIKSRVQTLRGVQFLASEYGAFVTLGTFSPASRSFEQGKANLRLIDGEELVNLIFDHYEQFASKHKGFCRCGASTYRRCWTRTEPLVDVRFAGDWSASSSTLPPCNYSS